MQLASKAESAQVVGVERLACRGTVALALPVGAIFLRGPQSGKLPVRSRSLAAMLPRWSAGNCCEGKPGRSGLPCSCACRIAPTLPMFRYLMVAAVSGQLCFLSTEESAERPGQPSRRRLTFGRQLLPDHGRVIIVIILDMVD